MQTTNTHVEIKRSTNQEIFETSVTHMVKQSHRARSGGVCKYRADDDSSCAVGCLILPDEYNEAMEGRTVDRLMYDPVFSGLFEWAIGHRNLLVDLQTIHDCHLDDGVSKDFIDTTILVANRYRLDYTFFTNLLKEYNL